MPTETKGYTDTQIETMTMLYVEAHPEVLLRDGLDYRFLDYAKPGDEGYVTFDVASMTNYHILREDIINWYEAKRSQLEMVCEE